MSIQLESMTQERFNQYCKDSLKEYAAEHVYAGNWKEEDAIQKAEEQFEQLLPEGFATRGHVFLSILHDDEPVGILWLYIQANHQEKQAFIYDIKLDENKRGNGLGKATMAALDEYALSEGIKQIRLHVFAHNERAIALYKKMGFEMTDYHMAKRLS